MASVERLVVLMLLAFSIVLFTVTLVLFTVAKKEPFDYGITVDAGSSHSEVILFSWSKKVNGTSFAVQKESCSTKGGIDDNMENITVTLDQLFPCVQQIISKIPSENSGPFPFFLGATAGMRVLKLTDPDLADRIFNAIKNNLTNSDFDGRKLRVGETRILAGSEEGLYAWISANYLLNFIPPENQHEYKEVPLAGTIGILDMGGASAQIAFQNDAKHDREVTLFGRDYNVRAYSNLCFGSDQARERYRHTLILESQRRNTTIEDPCSNKDPTFEVKGSEFIENPCLELKNPSENIDRDANYRFVGNYNFEKCLKIVGMITNKMSCEITYKKCFETEETPKDGITFFALSSYFHSTKVLPSLKSNETVPSEEYLMKEINQWCQLSWDEKKAQAGERFADSYCFKQFFVVQTLRNIYNFNSSDWSRIHMKNKIKGSSLGWSLGFMLQATNSIAIREPSSVITLPWFLTITVLTLITLIGSAIYYVRKRRSLNL